MTEHGPVNYDDFKTIRVEVGHDHVATVTLDRPERLNAFNNDMRADFARLWPRMSDDDSVRAVVLAAAGNRAFSTGLDVTERLESSESPWVDEARPWNELEDPGHDLGPKRNEFWKPIIAAVQGMCAGGAFYWVAECDVVICTPDATFFDPHVTYGLVAALEPIALTYRMRRSDVIRMALMGLHERMSAETALESGLVSDIIDAPRLLDEARRIAATIASQPPAAVQGTVKAIWKSMNLSRSQAMDTALLYTQVGNPIATSGLDRQSVKGVRATVR